MGDSKLTYTNTSDILPAYETVRATFLSGKTRPIAWRKHQLKQLGFLVQDNEAAFISALETDLGRPGFETIVGEINPLKGEINDAYKHVDKWAKPRSVKTSAVWALAEAKVNPEPKGAVLIIGTWNYPVNLLLGPLIGAISAGCTAILKPAEQTPTVAALFESLVPKYLDSSAYIVVNGAVEQTTKLLEHRFDHMFYTGSGGIGRIIAVAAAQHLTPITLELGGKSPACVFDDADVETVGKRIMWGKYANSGQICISPDYVLCSPEMAPKLITSFKSALSKFNTSSADLLVPAAPYCKIVSPTHFARLSKLLDETKGTVVIGGGRNADTDKMEVTVVEGVKGDDALMQGEVFGPILPILLINSKEEMVSFIQARDNPLALYAFTKSKANRDFLFNNTRSGTFVQNDVLIQFAIPGLPFGGAGQSGYGNYHSKYSFDTFSHERSSASVPPWMESLLESRYPPYTPGKLKFLLLATGEVIRRPSKYPDLVKSLIKLIVLVSVILGVRKTSVWKSLF